MTKRFLPGTLNPLYEGESPHSLDIEEFNNPNYAKELRKSIIQKKLEQDLMKGLDRPKAVILGPAKFSFQNPGTDYAVPVNGTTAPKMYTWYYFRIPEIHSHLQDPCSPRLLAPENKAEAYKAIHDHPIAPYIPALGSHHSPTQIQAGSVVEINYDRGPDVGMSLFPKIVKVVSRAYGLLNVQGCESLLEQFATDAGGYETVGSTTTGDQGGSATSAPGTPQTLIPYAGSGKVTPPPCKGQEFCRNGNCPKDASSTSPPDRFCQLDPQGTNGPNYRGAALSSKAQLEILVNTFGIKHVVSLAQDSSTPGPCKGGGREPVKDASLGCSGHNGGNPCEKLWAQDLGLTWYYIGLGRRPPPVAAWTQIHNYLSMGNTYIHCTHGVDRTGAIAAKWKKVHGVGGTEDELYKYTTDFGGQWEQPNRKDAAAQGSQRGGANWKLWKWIMEP